MKDTNKNVQVADLLHSAAIHLLRWVRTQDESLGVSPARLSALSVIVFGGPVSLNKLAEIEQVKPPTMVRIIDSLEGAGLVKRKTDPEDGRAILITPTEKGTTLMTSGRRKRVQYLAQRIRDLNPGDLEHLEIASRLIKQIIGK